MLISDFIVFHSFIMSSVVVIDESSFPIRLCL